MLQAAHPDDADDAYQSTHGKYDYHPVLFLLGHVEFDEDWYG